MQTTIEMEALGLESLQTHVRQKRLRDVALGEDIEENRHSVVLPTGHVRHRVLSDSINTSDALKVFVESVVRDAANYCVHRR